MTGIYNIRGFYDGEKNPSLKRVKNLVPRIVTYDDTYALCLIEKYNHIEYHDSYYCFLSKYGVTDKDKWCYGDTIKKPSLEDYFKISYRLKELGLIFNLKKIIYDSNRNK
jgi:hypothetical protein